MSGLVNVMKWTLNKETSTIKKRYIDQKIGGKVLKNEEKKLNKNNCENQIGLL